MERIKVPGGKLFSHFSLSQRNLPSPCFIYGIFLVRCVSMCGITDDAPVLDKGEVKTVFEYWLLVEILYRKIYIFVRLRFVL